MRFQPGQRVAWSHRIGPSHTPRSVMFEDAVRAMDSDAQFGTIVPAPAERPAGWPPAPPRPTNPPEGYVDLDLPKNLHAVQLDPPPGAKDDEGHDLAPGPLVLLTADELVQTARPE